MDFFETLANRHSVRDFSSQPVSEETIQQIVTAAGQTPSWANDQIWKVVVATGAPLQTIKQHHLVAAQAGTASHFEFPAMHRDAMAQQGRKNVVTWSNDLQDFLGADAQQMGTAADHLFNAPAVAYLLMPAKSSLWSAYDLGAFGQSLMLAATALGVDSLPAAEFVAYPEKLHEVLGVANDYQFGMGIGLGYQRDTAKLNQFRSQRMPLNQYFQLKK